MKTFFKTNYIFILAYFFTLFEVGTVLLNDGKVQIHQKINAFVGNPFLDSFFKYATHFGDGVFAVLIVMISLFINIKKACYILLSYVFAGITSSILKNYFENTCRPAFCFHHYARIELKLIEGVEMNMFNSFPSGHTTTAFAVFISLMFMSKSFPIKILWFSIAFLVAFSRTYLSQHWLVDIYFGSIIGFCFALFFYLTFYLRINNTQLDKGIIDLIKSKKK